MWVHFVRRSLNRRAMRRTWQLLEATSTYVSPELHHEVVGSPGSIVVLIAVACLWENHVGNGSKIPLPGDGRECLVFPIADLFRAAWMRLGFANNCLWAVD